MDCSPPASSVRGFPRQEYWSGLPFPSPEDLPDPGIKPASTESPALQANCLPAESLGKPIRALIPQGFRRASVTSTAMWVSLWSDEGGRVDRTPRRCDFFLTPPSPISHHRSPLGTCFWSNRNSSTTQATWLTSLSIPEGEEKGIPPWGHIKGGDFPLFAIVIPVVTLVNKQTSEKTQRGVKIDLHRADNCAFHLFTSSNKLIPGVTFINKRHYQVPAMWLTEINYPAHGKTITSLQCCNICATWKWDKCCGCNLHSMQCINYLQFSSW